MFAKRVPQVVKFLITFVAVLGGLWLILELLGSFFADSWAGTFATWNDDAWFWVLIAVSAIITFIGIRYAPYLGLSTERERSSRADPTYSFDSSQHIQNRENIIANVKSAYIDGVLRHALHNSVRIELKLENMPEMLQRQLVKYEGQEIRQPVGREESISDVFVSSGRALLILGAPGSGKTIALLELCQSLLYKAENEVQEPIPVVLNLSTWAEKQENLADWIVYEMNRQYSLSTKATLAWLTKDHLCLLLDGLDEVRPDVRDKCIQAINHFSENYDAPIVICSRIADYEELSQRLNLSKAIAIQPLEEEQIKGYLTHKRLKLDAVYEAVERDDALQELSKTPLMLNIMTVAYRGYSLEQLQPLLEIGSVNDMSDTQRQKVPSLS